MTNIRAISTQIPIVKALIGAAMLALLGVLAIGVSGASAQAGTLVEGGNDDAYGTAVCVVKGAAGTAVGPVDGPVHDAADDDEAFGPDNLNDTDGGTFDFSTTGVLPASGVICAGTDVGGEVTGTLAATDFEIVAGTLSRIGEGEYTNKVLPTGHAEGSADLCGPAWVLPGPPQLCADGQAPGIPATYPLGGNQTNLVTRFSIPFVAGQGPLAITSFDGVVDLTTLGIPTAVAPPLGMGDDDGAVGPADDLQDIDTGHGVGVVSIGPDPAAPAPDTTVATPDCNLGGGGAGYAPGAPGFEGTNAADDVTGFIVEAAFTATLSGDTDIGNNENDDAADPSAICDV